MSPKDKGLYARYCTNTGRFLQTIIEEAEHMCISNSESKYFNVLLTTNIHLFHIYDESILPKKIIPNSILNWSLNAINLLANPIDWITPATINSTVKLNELIQSIWGKNMNCCIIDKTGHDHAPVITIKILLPDDTQFIGYGINQKLARKDAAIHAITYIESSVLILRIT